LYNSSIVLLDQSIQLYKSLNIKRNNSKHHIIIKLDQSIQLYKYVITQFNNQTIDHQDNNKLSPQ
jgi:hypothetical protein